MVVVFVCKHGAAKSVIAASYLPHLARAAGRAIEAIARGTEPEADLSPRAVAGLRADGLPAVHHRPQAVSNDELATASAVVSFGPALGDRVPEDVPCFYWKDVPAVSEGFEPARDRIVAHLADLIDDLGPPVSCS